MPASKKHSDKRNASRPARKWNLICAGQFTPGHFAPGSASSRKLWRGSSRSVEALSARRFCVWTGMGWHPPYRLEITPLLHPGENELRIVACNTAINALAGRALPDYLLLWDRYGILFLPQDMHALKPLPSGLVGSVTLIVSAPAQ